VEGNPRRELVEIDASEAPRLLVINTELSGREFACIRSELKIGRTDDNDIAIDHRSLSRTHAKVVREDNGEWRVIDMQSANGVKVNDETYAQATLRPGDTLELGHVKFRFLAPGEEFKVPPEEGGEAEPPPPRRSRAGVGVFAGLVVVLGSAAGAYFALRPTGGGVKPPPPPPQLIARAPEPPPAPPPVVAPAPPPPPETPKVDPQFELKLKEARDSAARLDFRKAVSVLGLLRQDPNLPADMAKEVDTLLAQSNGEIQAKQHIDEAQKALVAGDWKGADQHLGEADGTQAYAREQADLRKRIDEARAREQASAAVRPKLPPQNGPDQNILNGISEDALTLIRKKEYRLAIGKLNTCLGMDPKYSRCHFLAGVTYGFLKESEKAAEHYQVYLKLSPDDPAAEKVRKILDDYEATKKPGNK
jgi:pSer/pThr/pTyr-binding forkhead associated (FHA) protein